MEFNVNIVLILTLAAAGWKIAASEDCALVGKSSNQEQTLETNARRQAEDSDDDGRYLWRKMKRSTPQQELPAVFYPRGSSPVTVTLLPLHFLYVNKQSYKYPCTLWVRLCMRAYDTGYICAHALHGTTHTFVNYCSMDYANCQIRASVWQLAYFGSCNTERLPDVGEDFDIEGDNFLEAAIINSPPMNALTGEVMHEYM